MSKYEPYITQSSAKICDLCQGLYPLDVKYVVVGDYD